MNNLEKRVQRHINTATNKNLENSRWHIDYLLSDSNVEIIKTDKFPSKIKEECERNQQILNRKNATVPIKGFGSSDCRQCPAHLIKID